MWFKLLHLYNTSGWPEWVQTDTRRLMLWLDTTDKRAAYRARDALVGAGLLEYVRGHKSSPNRYRLLFFPQDPYAGGKSESADEDRYGTQTRTRSRTQSRTQSCTQSCTQSRTQSRTQNTPDPGDIIRQDKEKMRQDDPCVPAELAEVFRAYAEMRRKMRKPLTESATQLVLETLEALAPQRPDLQKQILEQSILNGWAGVFPLKAEEAPEPPASYDIGEFERRLLYDTPVYRKQASQPERPEPGVQG